ncbi:Chromatin SPT2 [Arabidopsis suecica]|uniref:Chromatin SPT2 n=1 Tax=Arabidopsis suecica TaxID=45249 RepID=A0A8T1YF67_ARASU|nr:Chromatin SPT2 [Arabidopsis suecica]
MQNGNTIIAPTSQTHGSKINLPYNDFGSFFGPSQTVIASRVLQESKSLLENETLRAKMLNSVQNKNPVQMNASGAKNANEVKRKAEKLKDARDYSFLFSDDAQLPVSIKEPPKSRPTSRESQMNNHSKQASSGSQMLPRPGSSTNVQAHTSGDSARKYCRKQKSINKNGQPSSKLGPQRPLSSSKPLAYDPQQQRVKQRNVSLELTRSQLPPAKRQLISEPPLKRAHQLKKKKKKPVKMSEDDLAALQMVRQMCKTDRFAGRDFEEDYDDRCMEANFDDIMREEKRSEKLAKKEDAEQLRLIEEEERVRKQKKQKLSH